MVLRVVGIVLSALVAIAGFLLALIATPDTVVVLGGVLAAVGVVAVVALAIVQIRMARQRHDTEAASLSPSSDFRDDVTERDQVQARKVYATNEMVYEWGAGHPFGWTEDVKQAIFEPGVDWTYSETDRTYSATTDCFTVVVWIHNTSEEIVGPVSVSLYDKQTMNEVAGGMATGTSDPLFPGEKMAVAFVFLGQTPAPLVKASLKFRDAGGRWWRRRDYEPIERLAGEFGM